MSETETTTEKGDRNEREAVRILARIYGIGNVDKVHRYANNDPLGFIDVLAAREGWPVRFVQVKTNTFDSRARTSYCDRARRFPESVVVEVWVRVDYQGWEMHRYSHDSDDFYKFLSMDTCDKEETVEALRNELGYYGSGTAEEQDP